MNQEHLSAALRQHRRWLDDDSSGRPADLRNEDLAGLDLFDFDLDGVRLEGADLRRARAGKVRNLQARQLAGTLLDRAELPPATLSEISGKGGPLEGLREQSGTCRKLLFLLITACAYCLLTIATTRDELLLTNLSASKLPVINAEIPILSFYGAAPLILLAAFLYFQIHLDRLWKRYERLPRSLPDGTDLRSQQDDWLLTGLLSSEPGDTGGRLIAALQDVLSRLAVRWAVVLTLLLLWLRCLPKRDWGLTSLQVVMTVLAASLIVYFGRLKQRRLDPVRAASEPMSSRRLPAILALSLVYFSVGAIEGHTSGHLGDHPRGSEFISNARKALCAKGVPKEAADGKEEPCYANLFVGEIFKGLRRIIPLVEPREYYDLEDAEVSMRRADVAVARGDGPLPTILHIAEQDLRFAKARNAVLARADLSSSRLQFADFRDAQLQHSNLEKVRAQGAILEGANLQFARLVRAKLISADLSSSDLRHSKLEASFLNCSDLRNADLREAEFFGAELGGARFEKAKMAGASFELAQYVECNAVAWMILGGVRKLPETCLPSTGPEGCPTADALRKAKTMPSNSLCFVALPAAVSLPPAILPSRACWGEGD